MDVGNISSIISSVGFPIVMCIIMFEYLQKESENHREETASLKDAITKLEVAIVTLTERMNKGEEK